MKGRRNSKKDYHKIQQIVTRCSLLQNVKFEHETCGQFKTKTNPQADQVNSQQTCKHCQYSY